MRFEVGFVCAFGALMWHALGTVPTGLTAFCGSAIVMFVRLWLISLYQWAVRGVVLAMRQQTGWFRASASSARSLIRSLDRIHTAVGYSYWHLYRRTRGDAGQVRRKMAVERSSSVFSDDAGPAPGAVAVRPPCVVWWCGESDSCWCLVHAESDVENGAVSCSRMLRPQ